MSALSPIIVSLCMIAQGNVNVACNTALDAGAQQSGITAAVQDAERMTTKYADGMVTNYLGVEGKEYAGATIYLVKVFKEQRVNVSLPTLGLADQIRSEFSANGFSFAIKWTFQ